MFSNLTKIYEKGDLWGKPPEKSFWGGIENFIFPGVTDPG